MSTQAPSPDNLPLSPARDTAFASGSGAEPPDCRKNLEMSQQTGRLITDAAETGQLEDPVLADRLGELHLKAEILRLTAYRGLTAIEKYGQPGPEGSPMQLVQGVSADADREEEGRQRGGQPVGVDDRRRGRPQRHIAEVPCGVRRVQQRDQVTPAARLERIERRPLEITRGRRHL